MRAYFPALGDPMLVRSAPDEEWLPGLRANLAVDCEAVRLLIGAHRRVGLAAEVPVHRNGHTPRLELALHRPHGCALAALLDGHNQRLPRLRPDGAIVDKPVRLLEGTDCRIGVRPKL